MNEQLKIIISAEIDKLKKGVQDAKGQIDDLSKDSKTASTDIDENFQKMGEGAKNAMSKVATAMAAGAAALVALSATTTEYRQNQAQLNAAFEQAGFSAKAAKDAHAELFKVIGDDDQATESAANIAMLADSEKEAAQWAELASGVLGTFHDTLQPEAFYEAANEVMKLNESTGAWTQMLEQTGVMTVDEFNKKLSECTTESEKQALMLEVANKAMGGAGEAYNKATENIQKQREAQLSLNDTLASLGESLAPVVTTFIEFGAEVLSNVTPHIQDLAEKYGPALNTALDATAAVVGKIMGFISEHFGIISTLAAIIGGITIAIGLYNTVAAVKVAMAAAEVTSVWALVAAYAAQAAAMIVAIAPYVLIVAAIAAVIAIIVLCVKHWDKIKETVVNVAKIIWSKVKEMADKVVNFFTAMKDGIVNKVEDIKKGATDKFNSIKTSISNKVQEAKELAVNAFTTMKSNVTDRINGIKTSVSTVFTNIKDGIKNKINGARDAVKTAIDKIKDFMDFNWSLPKLKMPTIKITGKFSLNPPSAPKFKINWNKLGGIFDKPTLFNYGGSLQGLGEDGAEAVVPLEKNTKWLDKLADKITARQGNTPIVLQVDGKTFAQVSIDSINALTRQRGSLGLNLV